MSESSPPVASVPRYLADYADLYSTDPRAAALRWFQDARFGLFMHYGLYSLHGHGEWAMFHEKIPLDVYDRLADRFTAEHFDADAITDLALEAGMRYVNITTRHHDSFCLFDSAATDFKSTNTPAKRDLVAELAQACDRKGLGLFLYYSYAADWRHPYFMSREQCVVARPDYDAPEPRYLYRDKADFAHYIAFVHMQLKELLTNYGPIAGLWFDPVLPYYAQPELFPIDETYTMIRRLQPQALIAFKQGANGDEDFCAPERSAKSLAEMASRMAGDAAAAVAQRAWERNQGKPTEICDTLQPGVWGYRADDDGHHRDVAEVEALMAGAAARGSNLLLNTGPLPDGSIPPQDIQTLRAVGQRLRTRGWPASPATEAQGATSATDASVRPINGGAAVQ